MGFEVKLFLRTKPPISRLYRNFNSHGYSAFLAKYSSRDLARRFISPDNVPVENTRLCLLLDCTWRLYRGICACNKCICTMRLRMKFRFVQI